MIRKTLLFSFILMLKVKYAIFYHFLIILWLFYPLVILLHHRLSPQIFSQFHKPNSKSPYFHKTIMQVEIILG